MQDITSLEQSLTGTSINTDDIIGTLLTWIILPSVIIMIVFIIAVIVNSIRRWRVEQAIFEIRDILREMNQTKPAIDNRPNLNPDTKRYADSTTSNDTPDAATSSLP